MTSTSSSPLSLSSKIIRLREIENILDHFGFKGYVGRVIECHYRNHTPSGFIFITSEHILGGFFLPSNQIFHK